jgi:uncharacterized protein YlxW (UPF0749 family)
MRMRHMPWAIALVCVVLGFMLSMQFKVQQQVREEDEVAALRTQDLAGRLQEAESQRDSLATEVDTLRKELTKVAGNEAGNQALAQQLQQAQVQAGLVAITGPGVTVELRDAPANLVTPGGNPANQILHDQDLLRTVNYLFGAKAEAISVNDQRFIDRSELICAGPVIIVNGVRTAPPIIIKAVGNPDDLEMSIMMKGGIAEELSGFGIQFTVKKEQNVTVPAYKGSTKLQYGQPAMEVTKP